MIAHYNNKRRGFSLTELSIVLGVFAILITGIWSYASYASQNAKVEQSMESINALVDATRSAYGSKANIQGGVATVWPYLVTMGSIPGNIPLVASPGCQGTAGSYGVNAWGGTNLCGTLRVCGWVVGTNDVTGCPLAASATASQFFAIEFSALSIPACIRLVTRPTATYPSAGLISVTINAVTAPAPTVPVLPTTAESNCNQPLNGNVVDFVYSLRAPMS